jgi:NAD(P)-dependent dehydrogenase (short-subunit alcohol dehydrogenase family)
MAYRMDGHVSVVTGTATGIGRTIALRLATEGAHVVCGDVDGAGAERTAAEIVAAGGAAEAVRCDVSNADDVESMMLVAEQLGGPTSIVSNAAVQYEETIEDTPPDEWDRVLGVNLRSVYLCARAAIPRMRRLGGGSIVNMASVNGFWVEPALGAYCAANSA